MGGWEDCFHVVRENRLASRVGVTGKAKNVNKEPALDKCVFHARLISLFQACWLLYTLFISLKPRQNLQPRSSAHSPHPSLSSTS